MRRFHADHDCSGAGRGAMNVVALVKGKENYVLLYRDQDRPGLIRTFGRFAVNPALSFDWHDCAVLSQRVRMEAKGWY